METYWTIEERLPHGHWIALTPSKFRFGNAGDAGIALRKLRYQGRIVRLVKHTREVVG
jgi:hypothetical protein